MKDVVDAIKNELRRLKVHLSNNIIVRNYSDEIRLWICDKRIRGIRSYTLRAILMVDDAISRRYGIQLAAVKTSKRGLTFIFRSSPLPS